MSSFSVPCSFSLYEPKDSILREYKGSLEKAILRNSTLLDELNDAFCKTHPWLAQKICTRSVHAAVNEVSAGALLNKALSKRRKIAGEFLHDVRAINAIKSDILGGVRYHTANSEPYFYDAAYNHTRQLSAIPVDHNGRCVVAEEVGDRHCGSMRPLKWKCTRQCRLLTSCEMDIVLGTKELFHKCTEDV